MDEVQPVRTWRDYAFGFKHYAHDAWHRSACGRTIVPGPLGGHGEVSEEHITRDKAEVTCKTCRKAIAKFRW